MFKPRRTEIAKIADQAQLRTSFTKRRQGLFKKASELCTLTGASAAVVVFSNTDRLYSFGNPSVEEIISDYPRCEGDVMSPMGLKELVDWLEKQHDSCKTKEDFNSLILKHEAVLHCVREKLKDIGAGGDAAVGHVGLGVHPTPTRSNLEGCEFNPDNFNLSKDCTSKGNHIGFLTLPENSAVGSDSSGKEPMRYDLEGLKYDPEDFVGLEDLNVSLEI
ncbi:hypothetical protein NL676_029159 [Syzygium grande]|nr:hypothetical protein NL676_029159 [Syzygium grande]